MKKLLLIVVFLIAAFTPFAPIVSAATIDIPVLPAGDVVHYYEYNVNQLFRNEYVASANPNEVYWYSSDHAHQAETALTFGLPTLLPDFADILSVTLNYNVMEYIEMGGSTNGTLQQTGGVVDGSNGLGWQSFDITTHFTTNAVQNTPITYNFIHGGWAGFTFGSAEGGLPAYLQVTTVPEPATMLLFGTGLLSLAGVNRKKIK